MHFSAESTHASIDPQLQSNLWGTSTLSRVQPVFQSMAECLHGSCISQHLTIRLFVLSVYEVCCPQSALIPQRQYIMRSYHLLPDLPAVDLGRSAPF